MPPSRERHDDRNSPPVGLLERLERKAECDPDFSPQEVEILRQIIEAYRGWAMLGRMTKWLVAGLAGFSVVAVALSHLTGALRKWLLP